MLASYKERRYLHQGGSIGLGHPGSLQRRGEKVFEPECSGSCPVPYCYVLTRDMISSLPHRWGNKDVALPGKQTLFHRFLKMLRVSFCLNPSNPSVSSVQPELGSDYHVVNCQWHCHFEEVDNWALMISRSDGEALIKSDVAFHTLGLDIGE